MVRINTRINQRNETIPLSIDRKRLPEPPSTVKGLHRRTMSPRFVRGGMKKLGSVCRRALCFMPFPCQSLCSCKFKGRSRRNNTLKNVPAPHQTIIIAIFALRHLRQYGIDARGKGIETACQRPLFLRERTVPRHLCFHKRGLETFVNESILLRANRAMVGTTSPTFGTFTHAGWLHVG